MTETTSAMTFLCIGKIIYNLLLFSWSYFFTTGTLSFRMTDDDHGMYVNNELFRRTIFYRPIYKLNFLHMEDQFEINFQLTEKNMPVTVYLIIPTRICITSSIITWMRTASQLSFLWSGAMKRDESGWVQRIAEGE